MIIGAGAAGLSAALAVRAAGLEALVLERDAAPRGSTALSAGLIPAADTRWQREEGIDDSAPAFAADIMAQSAGRMPTLLSSRRVSRAAGPAIEWLADSSVCRSGWSTTSTIRAIPRCACTGCRAGRAQS